MLDETEDPEDSGASGLAAITSHMLFPVPLVLKMAWKPRACMLFEGAPFDFSVAVISPAEFSCLPTEQRNKMCYQNRSHVEI